MLRPSNIEAMAKLEPHRGIWNRVVEREPAAARDSIE